MTDQTRWGIHEVQSRNKAIKHQKDLVARAMEHVLKMDESGITDLMIEIEAEYEQKYGQNKKDNLVLQNNSKQLCELQPFAKGSKVRTQGSAAFGIFSKKGSIVFKLCSNMTFATFLPQKCEPYPLFCEPILRQCEGSRRQGSGRISYM